MSYKIDESNLRRSNIGSMNTRADGSNRYDPPRGSNLPLPMALVRQNRTYPGETIASIPAMLTGAATRSPFTPQITGSLIERVERSRSFVALAKRIERTKCFIEGSGMNAQTVRTTQRGSHLPAGGIQDVVGSSNRARSHVSNGAVAAESGLHQPIKSDPYHGAPPFDAQTGILGPGWKVFLWQWWKNRGGQ